MADEHEKLNWREIAFIAAVGVGILLNVLGVFKTLPGTNLDTAVFVNGYRRMAHFLRIAFRVNPSSPDWR
ncbi:MAG: hypothetical protein RMK94_15490 [Armatimonadota bacterium]|nr:hypothetical protein [Armatimonadota bacterium]